MLYNILLITIHNYSLQSTNQLYFVSVDGDKLHVVAEIVQRVIIHIIEL